MIGYYLQQIINGMQLGSIYALIALGFTMIYGIIRLINFAHADIFMVGAYIAFFLVSFAAGSKILYSSNILIWLSVLFGYLSYLFILSQSGITFSAKLSTQIFQFDLKKYLQLYLKKIGIQIIHFIGVCICSFIMYWVLFYSTKFIFSQKLGIFLLPITITYVLICCGVLGVCIERLAYRPLRYKQKISSLITALGVSLFLENFCSLKIVFNNVFRPFPEIISKVDIITVPSMGIGITNLFIINITVTLVLLLGLWIFVEYSIVGKQMRAVAFDPRVASLMGINVDRIISFTFMIGSGLAGVAGILYAMNYGILQSPFLGFFPGLKAFIAAVIGGIGSLPGAVIGAFFMGISEVFASSLDSNIGFGTAFIALIIILLLRPNGILGKQKIDRI